MVWLPRCAQKNIVHTFFAIFRPKIIFSCKTAYAIFKVVYQASHIPISFKMSGNSVGLSRKITFKGQK